MKYLLYCVLGLLLVSSCKNRDNETFGELPQSDVFRFEPAQGGAVMYYSIPESDEIYSINVRYKDERGKDILVSGSYLSDSLLLTGFNEAANDIAAEVFYTNRDHVPSEAISAKFSTLRSGAVLLFDNLDVSAHWFGFKLEYAGVPNAKAQVHVYYKGVNPLTQVPEDILLESFVVSEFDEIRYYTIERGGSVNDIVVKTEDYYGYEGKTEVYENVPLYISEKIAYDNGNGEGDYTFIDPFGMSVEEPDFSIGMQYLFDGDTKGENTMGVTFNPYNTFVSAPFSFSDENEANTADHKYYALDLKEETQVASIRLHTMLDVRSFDFWDKNSYISDNWGTDQYSSRLPSHVKVYASNDAGDDMTAKNWTYISEIKSSPDIDVRSRWCAGSPSGGLEGRPFGITDPAALQAADEQYMELQFAASLPKYRYVRFDVIDTFDMFESKYSTFTERNEKQQFTINEIEVYVKSE